MTIPIQSYQSIKGWIASITTYQRYADCKDNLMEQIKQLNSYGDKIVLYRLMANKERQLIAGGGTTENVISELPIDDDTQD